MEIATCELVCPLCCGQTFQSRDALKQHLSQAIHNVPCPVCHKTQTSIEDLLVHLDSESCGISVETEIFESVFDEESGTGNVSHEIQTENEPDKDSNADRMDETSQVFSNDLSVMSDSENHILIMSTDSEMLANRGIITTQNEDGTISFTQVGAVEEMSDGDAEEQQLLQETREDNEAEQELYTCSSCGVSFTSVVDHIHQYHGEQDVVVEMAESECEAAKDEDILNDTALNKRVINATGNIITEEQYDHLVIQKEFSIPIDEGGDDQMKPESWQTDDSDDKTNVSCRQKLVRIKKFWETSQPTEEGTDDSEDVQFKDGQAMMKVFGCSKCHIKSTSLQVLENHVCRIRGVYNCEQCTSTFDNSKSLCAHMKAHKKKSDSPVGVKKVYVKTEPNAVFKCDTCETVFTSNKSLRLHKRMHVPIKSRPMEAPVCYEGEVGEGEDTYHCGECDKWIHVGYRHVHDEYHAAEQFHCDVCNRKFMSEDYLNMHMNVHNSKTNVSKQDKAELPYSCVFCERRFARPHEKVKHERIHTGEKPHACEICGKAFRVSYCLTLHMRTHTGERPYQCPHCFKRFKAHSVYNHHLLTHSDVRAYECPFCPKAFKTSVQLAGHKNSHTKPFSCNICNRPFASLYAVRVHTETHRKQNNLKFACKLCGATYARNFALKDHMKSAHNSKDSTEYYNRIKILDPALTITQVKDTDLKPEEVNPVSETDTAITRII